MKRILAVIRRHPVRTILIAAAGVIVVAAAVALPIYFGRKDSVHISVAAPEPRALADNSVIPPLTITFSASAAKIELTGKEITQGVSLSPDLKGKWVWSDDRTLVFFPRADWQPGTGYTVSFEKSIFSGKVKVADSSVSFRAAEFSAKIRDVQLYIDPAHPAVKRITATVIFTHPVRVEEFAKAVRFKLPFTITWDKFFATAYIVSENVPVPENTRTGAGASGTFLSPLVQNRG